MFANWEFLLGEVWSLIALAALLGLIAGWLIWNRTGELRRLRADLAAQKQEAEASKTQLAALSAEFEADKQTFAREQTELMDARRVAEEKLDRQSTTIDELGDQLEKVKAHEKLLASKMGERETLIQAKSRAESEHANEIARVRKKDEVISAMKTELHAARSESQRAAKLETELHAEKERGAKAHELETELNATRERAGRAEQLERDLSTANAQLGKLQRYEAEIETKTQRIAELERETDLDKSNQTRLAALERDLVAAKSASARADALQRDVTRLQGEVQSRDETIAKLRASTTSQAASSFFAKASAEPANTIPDYDGDGVQEGKNEGRKPATLHAARDGQADDLKRIKGVGPKLEKMLNDLGFYHYDQVASWSGDEVAWVDANLDGFNGRVSRENWIDQARVLASGGTTEFSSRVDEGDVYEKS